MYLNILLKPKYDSTGFEKLMFPIEMAISLGVISAFSKRCISRARKTGCKRHMEILMAFHGLSFFGEQDRMGCLVSVVSPCFTLVASLVASPKMLPP
jgi:hypothetical protein